MGSEQAWFVPFRICCIDKSSVNAVIETGEGLEQNEVSFGFVQPSLDHQTVEKLGQ